VAHPDLVPVARDIFDRVLGDRDNQRDQPLNGAKVDAAELLDFTVVGGAATLAGVETNVDVALRYIEAWLRGQGAVAIHNLMEDAATAEISRSQLWQWVRHEARIADDGTMTGPGYRDVRDRVLASLRSDANPSARWEDAAGLLDLLVLGDFAEFADRSGKSAARVADGGRGRGMGERTGKRFPHVPHLPIPHPPSRIQHQAHIPSQLVLKRRVERFAEAEWARAAECRRGNRRDGRRPLDTNHAMPDVEWVSRLCRRASPEVPRDWLAVSPTRYANTVGPMLVAVGRAGIVIRWVIRLWSSKGDGPPPIANARTARHLNSPP
jgi:hypothetical protein